MKKVISYSLRKWASIIALGFIFLPLLWLQASWSINVMLYAVFAVGYCILLTLLRIITFSEVVAVGRAFYPKNTLLNAPKSPREEYIDS
jgi:hypothetical protein